MESDVIIRYAFTGTHTDRELYCAIESPRLREHATRYRHTDARLHSLLGAYCTEFCARELGLAPDMLEYDFSAKPSARGFKFNVSHTQGLALCAASRTYEVGVDVEPIPSDTSRLTIRDNVARRCFSRREQQALQLIGDPSGRSAEFVRLWTAHEALGKYLGVGVFRTDVSEYVAANGLSIQHFTMKSSDGSLLPVPANARIPTGDYYIICVCLPEGISQMASGDICPIG